MGANRFYTHMNREYTVYAASALKRTQQRVIGKSTIMTNLYDLPSLRFCCHLFICFFRISWQNICGVFPFSLLNVLKCNLL